MRRRLVSLLLALAAAVVVTPTVSSSAGHVQRAHAHSCRSASASV